MLLILTCTHAVAAPTGGIVTAGSGSIAQSGATTTITQNSSHLSLNWASFNVGAAETVNFNQPNASAIAVNRIADVNGSQILGRLNANGQVFLINPHGLIFGAGSQVNVGGLVASTLDIADADLASASRRFAGTGNAGVVNHGTLTAAPGGYIALLGSTVTNTGTLTAPNGTVALGSGNRVSLDFAGDKLLTLAVSENTVAALAANGGLIRADGGAVYLSAGARNSLVASVVNNTGVIEAHTVDSSKGTIILLGGMAAGTTTVTGTLDASAPTGGDGGFIETSAAHVQILDGTRITTTAPAGRTGTWLVDPTNFTIAAGSGALTTSGIGAATLSTSLASTNVTLTTDATAHGGDLGDILVNADVSWATNELTLSAHNTIYFNANLTGTGTASLALHYGQGAVAAGNTSDYTIASGKSITLPAGPNFRTKLGSNGTPVVYTVITALGAEGSTTGTDLQGMRGSLAGKFALGANIDASTTSTWNAGLGFAPVGDGDMEFTGIFTGLGHTITGLTINRPGTDFVGLFGWVSGGNLRDLGLIGGSITGANEYVGGLVGYLDTSTLSNASSTGTVSGSDSVGGLVGYLGFSTISNASSAGAVSGSENVGGLVGYMNTSTISNSSSTAVVSSTFGFVGGLVGYSDDSTISNSSSTGAVSSLDSFVGGLVGYSYDSALSSVYSTGAVSGDDSVGGLVGWSEDSAINNTYSTSTVTGDISVGGLVGWSSSGSTISNSYSTGTVLGVIDVGGLVGFCDNSTLSHAYSTGGVTGVTDVGGLVGFCNNGSTISNAYSTGAVTGTEYVGGLVGYSSDSVFSSVYSIGAVSGDTDVGGLVGFSDASTITHAYWDTQTSGQAASPGGGLGKTTAEMLTQATYVGFDFATFWTPLKVNVNQGYPTLQALPVDPTINAIVFTASLSKTYGATLSGSLAAAGFSFTGTLFSGDSLSGLTFTSSGTGATANVGSYSLTFVSPTGTIADLSAYTFSFSGGSALAVQTRAVTLTATNQTKFFADLNPALTFRVTSGSLSNGDTHTGALATAARGNSALGTYAITQGDLSLGSNYALSFEPGQLDVLTRPVTLSALNQTPDRVPLHLKPMAPSATADTAPGQLLSATTLPLPFNSNMITVAALFTSQLNQ